VQKLDRARRSPWAWILAAAIAYTLVNALKPLTQDDTAYYYYAAHIAEHPADPYGFALFFGEEGPEPANQVLAPPVLLYWWAIGIKLLGNSPFLWKVWLLPISVLFAAALWSLFGRWALGWELPYLCATVFSPTFLPSLNLMLDVPSLALGLAGLATFLRACDRQSWGLAVGAGVLIALAMQTKYSAMIVPAVVLWAAVAYGRLPLGVVATVTSGLLFIAWEAYLTASGGTSHFLHHCGQSNLSWGGKVFLAKALINTLGAVMPWVALIGLVGLGVSRRMLVGVAALILVAQVLYLLLPEARHIYADAGPAAETIPVLVDGVWRRLKPFNLTFALGGLLVAGVVAALLLRSCWEVYCDASSGAGLSPRARDNLFLAGWVLIEGAGYFLLSPFPAMRRVMGLVVVITVVCGRAAAGRSERGRTPFVLGAVAANVVLGFGYYGLDCVSCFATVAAVERSVALVRVESPGARMWHDGMWGFQFHADRAGAQRVAVGRSELAAGDYLITPDDSTVNWNRPAYQEKLEAIGRVVIPSPVPVRREFYGGPFPIVSGSDIAQGATVYRVKAPFRVSPDDLRSRGRR
jgi:hypothetical protein